MHAAPKNCWQKYSLVQPDFSKRPPCCELGIAAPEADLIPGTDARPASTSGAEEPAYMTAVLDRAEQYLLTRQGPDGGFCSYRSRYVEDGNLADTACAIHAFTLLGMPVPDLARVVTFLTGFAGCRQPVQLLHLIETWQTVCPEEPLDAQIHDHVASLTIPVFPGADAQQTGWLERTRSVLRLKQWARDTETVRRTAEFVQSLEDDGAFGTTPNLWDTWLALDICALNGSLSGIEDRSRFFVDRLQCLPAGFTLTAHSHVATLNTVFAGFNCCRLLHMPLRYPREALRFVLGCQSHRGAFAPSPGALADIEMTDRALRVLLSDHCRAGERATLSEAFLGTQ
ncbi:prenyltransferase/squalene oxidase repeat-containing protein [Paraburkholderia xenovorans]